MIDPEVKVEADEPTNPIPPMRAGFMELKVFGADPDRLSTIWVKPWAIGAVQETIFNGKPAFQFCANTMWVYSPQNPVDVIEAYETAKLEGKMR